MSIVVERITKKYGQQIAVNNFSVKIPPGQTCGFLGPNGAGKSTVMKLMTGFLTPDEGEVFINGISITKNPYQAKRLIGYLPEHNPLYTGMFVREFLQFNAHLFTLSGAKTRIEDIIKLTGLEREAHKRIRALSKGYRQRVGLAQALLHNPPVLILDEPLNGLDPNQLTEIRELIIGLGKEKTVLFSSHILQEVELVANRILMIREGSIVHDSIAKTITENDYYILIKTDSSPNDAFLDQLEQLGEVAIDGNNIQLKANGEAARKRVFVLAQKSGTILTRLEEHKTDLTTIFKQKIQSE